jgi:hypothetical protein
MFSAFIPGSYANGQTLVEWTPAFSVALPQALSGNSVNTGSGIVATAASVIEMKLNGAIISTATIEPGGSSATFGALSSNTVVVSTGNVLSFIGPLVADATLADLRITIPITF